MICVSLSTSSPTKGRFDILMGEANFRRRGGEFRGLIMTEESGGDICIGGRGECRPTAATSRGIGSSRAIMIPMCARTGGRLN